MQSMEHHDFDDEARKIFARLNLEPALQHRYNELDPIWEHPETKARVYVGNQGAASKKDVLRAHGIGSVVNCTDTMPLYFDGDHDVAYLRFHISGWMSQVREPYTAARFHAFFRPVWEFVDASLESGKSVLVHCLAGAHRAGTTGVAFLMYKNGFGYAEAVKAATMCRPIINPIGLLRQLAGYYAKAIAAREAAGGEAGEGDEDLVIAGSLRAR